MKKIDQRNYFVVIDDSEEMWTAVKFATKRAKTTKSTLTTISFIESFSDGMMLTPSTEKILDKKNAANKLLNIVVGGMRKYFILFSHIAKLFPSLP